MRKEELERAVLRSWFDQARRMAEPGENLTFPSLHNRVGWMPIAEATERGRRRTLDVPADALAKLAVEAVMDTLIGRWPQ